MLSIYWKQFQKQIAFETTILMVRLKQKLMQFAMENVYIIGIMEHIEPWSALWR
jgi:hypothetical protein